MAKQLPNDAAPPLASTSPHRLYWLALALLLLAPVALFVDVPIARMCVEQQGLTPHAVRKIVDLHKLLALSETFAHGLGVALIVLTVIVLDPARRWRDAPRLLASSLGAGLAADVVKLCVGRTRPNVFEFEGGVADTFIGWAPLLSQGSDALSRNMQSFPSAHTATAFGFAVVLGSLYPRGRVLFFVFASLSALQRIEVGAHYLSDTFAGAALGCLFAALCIDSRRWPGRLFDRLEQRAVCGQIAEAPRTSAPSNTPESRAPAA